MRPAKFIPWLATGVVMFASQTPALANSAQMTVTAQFSDILADTEASNRAESNEQSGQASLSWHPDHSGISRLSFDGNRLPGQGNLDFSGLDSPFILGRLSFENGAAEYTSGINSAHLGLSFFWIGASTSPVEMHFGLNLTAQTLSFGKDHKSIHGDLLTLNNTTSSFPVNTDSGPYRLELLGWSRDGGQSFIGSLFVPNHAHEGLKLYAALQAVTDIPPTVPIPATAWLFGSGLVALSGLARRRRDCRAP